MFPAHHARIISFLPHRKQTKEGKGAVAGLPRSQWIRSLGSCDQLVEYFKSKVKPDWMGRSQYDALPESIVVRGDVLNCL